MKKIIKNIYYYLYNKCDRLLNWYVWKFKNSYNIEMPGGNCPVQTEGFLKTGEWYYFRARGSQWGLDICKNETDWFNTKYIFQHIEKDYLPWPECGWISKRECIVLVNKAIDKYYSENQE